MIKCKYRTILLFLLLIIYLNEVGARRNRNTRRKGKCTKPDNVSNARLKTKYERKEKFNDGDIVVYRCQPGYTMEGKKQRTCQNGNWTSVVFTCNQKCTKPDNVPNAELKTKYKRKIRFNDGDSVEYKCQPGYTKEGTSRKRKCQKGNWTGVRFSCNTGHPYRQSTLNQDLKVYGNISTDQILAETNKEYVGDLEFELMELDMMVDKSVNTPSSSQSFRGNINKHKSRRWPLEIHYYIGDKMSEAQENAIRKAIPIWQRYSCLSFSENKQAYDRIEFELAKDNMCWSYVGKKQGSQTISLGETCFEREIIVHEIGHALGFYHEHNRWDRDDYIKIHYENIEPGKTQHFQKRKNTVFDTNYDYMSIMHYGQYFFSKNESANLITIETTNDTFQSKIGKAKRPSFQDYKTLNTMYKCADRCTKIKCPEAGFLGKNCQCYCKGNPDGTSVKLCLQKGECNRPIHNKYLFDILEKDKITKVSIYRTSFPDKTVVHIYSSNWNCAPVSKLRCEDGEWKTKERSITECPVTLKIALTNKTEGVVKVTLNDYYDGYICDDDWDDNDATVACKMLGYTNGLAYFLKPQEVNKSLPFLLDNVQCSGNESSLAECKHNGWGNHNCRYTEVVTVKCFNSLLPYHIDKTECGVIQLGNSKRKKRQLKVVGGLDTIKGMHPWQVGIQRKQNGWVHRCGGTIINDKWILSAAHCFDDLETKYDGLDAKLDLKDIRVIVGDHDLTKHDEYEEIFYIEYIVKHWNYSEFERNYAINDIALLKIKSYIVFNDCIQPACLPESSDLSETKCQVSGWGKEKENGSMTDTLRAAQVTIIQEHDCLDFLKNYSIDFGKVICAGDGSADTCQGDSGGPLICEINGKSTVIGITSWGKGCGRKEAPGIYTNVSKYKRWINNQISNHRFEEGECQANQYRCANGDCIDRSYVCDGYNNCTDASDELNCGCSLDIECKYGGCVSKEKLCDGHSKCHYGDDCSTILCPELSVLYHGSRSITSVYSIENTYGSYVNYSCNTGYKLNGTSSIRCQSDGTWSDNEPTCEVILCPALSVLHYGSVSVASVYGIVHDAYYSCNTGYKLHGTSSIRCQSDGTWSDKEPTCEVILCPTPSPLQHGSLAFQKFGHQYRYYYRSNVHFKCDKDYYVDGDPHRQDVKRYCQSDGTWGGNEPTCEAILCPTLSPLQNGSLTKITSDGLTNKYGSVVEYTCNKDYYLNGNAKLRIVKRYCQSDGTWGGNEPTCEARLSPGKGGLDVILLVDISSIIGERSMKMAKQLMKQLVDNFGVSNETSGGTHGTRFALMTFSVSANVVFNLNDRTARSKTKVKKIIDGIQNTGGATDLKTVFSAMVTKVFIPVAQKDQRRFTDGNRAIVLLTDTEETNTSLKRSFKRFAHFLKKDLNCEIYCIGVGKDIDHSSLAEIASKPQLEHVFTLSKFKNPEKVGDIIAEKNIDYGQCGVSGNTDKYFRSQQHTNEGAWPWLGWLSVLDDENISHTCGGAVLCDRWFLTTASCVSKKRGDQVVPYNTSMINVYLSDFDLFNKDTNERRPIVQDIIIHDNYTGEEIGNLGIYDNDVALLDFGQNEAERPVLDKYLRPICIATDNVSLSAAETHFNTFPTSNKTAFIAGWGYAPDNIYHERQEMMQGMIQTGQKGCSYIYKFDLEGFFCIARHRRSHIVDIGGPYMVQMSDKRYYSLGLALKRSNQSPQHCIFLNLLHTPVSEWMTRVLDGCNRVENKDT